MVSTCEHGYDEAAATQDCPRCGERAPVVRVPHDRFPMTRWHKTATTMGPAPKVAITMAIVLPLIVMLNALRFAHEYVANAFLVVPIFGFIVVGVQLLPAVWEPGRRLRD